MSNDFNDVMKSLDRMEGFSTSILHLGLVKASNDIEADMVGWVPVDTGRLQKSIIQEDKSSYSKFMHEISANTPYAGYVEYGTSRQRAQPYIRPAFNKALPKLEALKDDLNLD